MKYTVKKMTGYRWEQGVEQVAVFDTLEEAKAYIDSKPYEGFGIADYYVVYGRNNRRMAKYNYPSLLWIAE